MAKAKNLDDIQLVISQLTGEVYIGQTKTDKKGNTLSDNKKDITQNFMNTMMMFFDFNKDKGVIESMAGTIVFTPKEDK